jgi:1-acyl-sn-glycerol-3-phosphate acyltransferase
VRSGLHAMAHIEVVGLENVPKSGPCLVVFNQLSLLDTPLLRISIPRSDVTGLVALEYSRNPFFRFMVERGGGIWIERGASDRRALEAALAALERGWVVGISPEGRRSRSGGLEKGKPGVAALAYRASVPIVPMGITNMGVLSRSLMRLHRARVTVRFGEPFRLPPPDPHDRRRQRLQAIDTIMSRLAAVIPERLRGVYAAHHDVLSGPAQT